MIVKKKINIAKIRTNPHVLQNEIEHWTPLDERLSQLCNNKNVKDETHLLIECPTYTKIIYYFQIICETTNLLNILTKQRYTILK